jgi:antitoxin VapB
MALNIKDGETERLATEVAQITGESKTQAVRTALLERRERLAFRVAPRDRGEDLRRFLREEAWPQIPQGSLGAPLAREERDRILGYGQEGV